MENTTKTAAELEQHTKLLDLTMKNIDKTFGKGTLIRMGDKPAENLPFISSGSIGLDLALGIGGIPKGRVIEIYGPESSSKTTTALHFAAECQKKGGTVAFIDAEHALDPAYAKNIGVNVADLLISQPDYGEQALEVVDILCNSGAVDLIIVDSVAALTPKVEIEGDMDDMQVGVQARLMSKALRKITGTLFKTGTTIIFINQLRMKIGMTGYGSPETTTGGNALKFYASVRIDVRRVQTLKQAEDSIGIKVKAKIVKNKVAPPFKIAEYEVMFGKGISRSGEIIDAAVKFNIIDKAGSWFSYNDSKLGQGKENSKLFLENNPELMNEIENKVRGLIAGSLIEEIDPHIDNGVEEPAEKKKK